MYHMYYVHVLYSVHTYKQVTLNEHSCFSLISVPWRHIHYNIITCTYLM